ncbi:Delta(12) fatty acid desaturase [Trametes pubescens]|uniref:Delta(12) fatty acid desaturase n=1 Tax=Trametes pubescens TaxID=154538 RepID=A0A1M2VNL4_TRAPU|nr:Delta(12) fatty acid desaturase [Trametes pubescens]
MRRESVPDANRPPAGPSSGLLPWLVRDAPEYEERKKRTQFVPPTISIKDVHAAVPRHLFEKSTAKSLFYVGRHVGLSALFYVFATRIDTLACNVNTVLGWGEAARAALSWALWAMYWFWQSCGHDALSPHAWVNVVLGMGLHTFVLTPYFAWRITHRSHHKGANNLARDETYHPFTRTDLKLPDAAVATPMDYKELIEETPLFTLFKMVIRQFLGFQLYLIHNRKGNPKYPPGTSHYKPSSKLFKPQDRASIIVSDVAIACMLSILAIWSYRTGFSNVWRLYFVPWLAYPDIRQWAHNWIVMFTYLQHSDPTVPYYREVRGASSHVARLAF